MGIEDPFKIDGMGSFRDTGAVVIWVSDAEVWEVGHLPRLFQKLVSQAAIFDSEPMLREYPDMESRERILRLFMLYRPPEPFLPLLDKTRDLLRDKYRVRLEYGPNPNQGYADDAA